MEWSDVRVFLAIARAGTLAAAGRALGQTQPTMGRRLTALEEAVGQRLFQRTNDGFLLTDEGAAVMMHAERIEEEMLSFQRRLDGKGQRLEGMLRITSSDWFGAHMLTPIVAAYVRSNPHVRIELLTDSRFFSLSRREADVAFRIRPFDEPDVVSRKLLTMPYGVYIRSGDPLPVVGDGSGSSLITMDGAFGAMPDVGWLKAHFPNATVALCSNNRDVQAQLCAYGGGIAVVPVPLAERFPTLQRVNVGEDPPSRDTWVGYHRDLRGLKRLRLLLDMVIEQIGNY